MPYIYKITNSKNNKIYIGKTTRTVQERWREHCKQYLRKKEEKRPLYSAMKKYGLDAFNVEEIEECPLEVLEERERHWIEHYQSFKYGYNATRGGDGKPYIDYDLVVATYREVQNMTATAKLLQIDIGSVSAILKAKNENVIKFSVINQNKLGKQVNQYDLNGNYIQTFPSLKNAAISIGVLNNVSERGASSHIGDVCRGKRKTAYGYIWRLADTVS